MTWISFIPGPTTAQKEKALGGRKKRENEGPREAVFGSGSYSIQKKEKVVGKKKERAGGGAG